MPAIDPFSGYTPSLESAPENAVDLDAVKSDTVDLATMIRAIYVGVAGDVKVTWKGGATTTYKNLPAGTTKVGRFVRVWSTGTTATSLVGEI